VSLTGMNGQQFVAELVAEDLWTSTVDAAPLGRVGVRAGALDNEARGPRPDEVNLPNRGPHHRLAVVAWPSGIRCTVPDSGGAARQSERLTAATTQPQ
jgi:hypothetical protein